MTMDQNKEAPLSQYPEVVGNNDTDSKNKVYEIERLINTLAAIIEKYAGQLDTAQQQRKAG